MFVIHIKYMLQNDEKATFGKNKMIKKGSSEFI